MLRQALFLARFDLGYLLKQKETLLWTFVMPGLFFYFMGTVTGGAGFAPNPTQRTLLEVELPYAVAEVPVAGSAAVDGNVGPPDADGSRSSKAPRDGAGQLALVGALDTGDEPDLDGKPDVEPDLSGDILIEQLALRLVAENFAVRFKVPGEPAGKATKRLVWPAVPAPHATWSEALAAGVAVEPKLLANRAGNGATFDEVRVSKALYGLLADLTVLGQRGEQPTRAAFQALAGAPRAVTLDERTAGELPAPPMGFAQAVPGTMVMFTLMILLTGGSIVLIQERRAGLFRRLASSPIPVGTVLVGKWLARLVLAAIQISFSMVMGSLLFGMDWGSELGSVCLVLGMWGAFCASLSLLLATVATTEGQMAGLAVIGTMVLAALGGCWWPVELTPGWMQDVADLLPTGWAMSGMHELVHFGRGFTSVVRELALLAGGTVVALWLGARRFRFD